MPPSGPSYPLLLVCYNVTPLLAVPHQQYPRPTTGRIKREEIGNKQTRHPGSHCRQHRDESLSVPSRYPGILTLPATPLPLFLLVVSRKDRSPKLLYLLARLLVRLRIGSFVYRVDRSSGLIGGFHASGRRSPCRVVSPPPSLWAASSLLAVWVTSQGHGYV